ncbi:unnamed protein product [Amoebophrya sp. A120]|nr:unnamed protein product [Amoebophrya sp. A120]|eukprot:GSA120T00016582001.1
MDARDEIDRPAASSTALDSDSNPSAIIPARTSQAKTGVRQVGGRRVRQAGSSTKRVILVDKNHGAHDKKRALAQGLQQELRRVIQNASKNNGVVHDDQVAVAKKLQKMLGLSPRVVLRRDKRLAAAITALLSLHSCGRVLVPMNIMLQPPAVAAAMSSASASSAQGTTSSGRGQPGQENVSEENLLPLLDFLLGMSKDRGKNDHMDTFEKLRERLNVRKNLRDHGDERQGFFNLVLAHLDAVLEFLGVHPAFRFARTTTGSTTTEKTWKYNLASSTMEKIKSTTEGPFAVLVEDAETRRVRQAFTAYHPPAVTGKPRKPSSYQRALANKKEPADTSASGHLEQLISRWLERMRLKVVHPLINFAQDWKESAIAWDHQITYDQPHRLFQNYRDALPYDPYSYRRSGSGPSVPEGKFFDSDGEVNKEVLKRWRDIPWAIRLFVYPTLSPDDQNMATPGESGIPELAMDDSLLKTVEVFLNGRSTELLDENPQPVGTPRRAASSAEELAKNPMKQFLYKFFVGDEANKHEVLQKATSTQPVPERQQTRGVEQPQREDDARAKKPFLARSGDNNNKNAGRDHEVREQSLSGASAGTTSTTPELLSQEEQKLVAQYRTDYLSRCVSPNLHKHFIMEIARWGAPRDWFAAILQTYVDQKAEDKAELLGREYLAGGTCEVPAAAESFFPHAGQEGSQNAQCRDSTGVFLNIWQEGQL